MFNFLEFAKYFFERFDKVKDNSSKHKILLYAIVSEAKINNDLAKVICRSGAKNLASNNPKIYNEFCVATSEILLAVGLPAKEIFGDKELPNEKSIETLDDSTFKMLLGKSSSELYEFYVRKCKMIQALYSAESLNLPRLSLYKRCKNIEFSTRILILRFGQKY